MAGAMPGTTIDPQRAWRDAIVAFCVVAVLVTGLVRINVTLPWIGHLGSALVSVLFLYVPLYIAGKRDEDLRDYGFVWEPVGRGLVIAGVAIAIIVPLFALGFYAFYETACHSQLLAHLAPARVCGHYGGLASLHAPRFMAAEPTPPVAGVISAEWCLVQWLVVGLPEELFFRGFLLKQLELRFPPRRRVLGGGIGLALVLSALAFAVIHLPKDGDPRALATFFPGLLFGWMRSATGSILAPTIAHGSSNILARCLEIMVSR
ncbi:MAG TPA: CPBP family intramembrane glutamic endopeptidase [Kofleriaceae bacterium]|nr:CPBP family intramembrane glutamic endopeptidase [Kofleriaceae bacterium]